MKKDKLFRLFYSLTPKEVKAFRTFVIGRKPTNISKLVEILAKHKQPPKEKDFEAIRQKAFRKLFPDKKDNTQNYRRLIADTLQLMNDFLVIQESKQKPYVRKALLQEQYKTRTLNELFESSIQTTIKTLQSSPERDFHYYRNMVKQKNDTYFYVNSNQFNYLELIGQLESLNKDLDLSYLLAKLHYIIQVKSGYILAGAPVQDNTFSYAELLKQYKDNPLVTLFLDMYNQFDSREEAAYFKLKAQWMDKLDLLSENLKLQTFGSIFNLAWYSVGSEKKMQELFELYTFAFKSGLLINSGYVEIPTMTNFVDLGVNIKEFEKVRQYITEYHPYFKVEPLEKENILNLYEAFLLYGEGKFDEAFVMSNMLKFENQQFGLRYYILIIKCLYETKKENSYTEIEARATAFKQFLHRKRKRHLLNAEKYQENLNFIKIATQLPITTSSRFSKVTPDQLREQLKAMPQVVSRAWLLEKIDEL